MLFRSSPYAYTNSGNITKEYDDADEIGNLPNSDFTGVGNPSAIIANSYNYVKQYRFNVGAHPEVKINENWKVETMFDYSLNKTKEDFKAPKKGIADYTLYSENGTALITVEDYLESQTMRDIQIFDDTRLTYSNKFKNNNINAMLGWRYLNNYYESDYVKGHNGGENSAYISSSLLHPYIYGLNNRTVSISTYLNANYSFMNKYFLTGMVSMDSSSRFGKDAKEGAKMFGVRWGFFPSISGAWLASSETFLKDVEWLDMLKVRAGYSVTGNDDSVD